LTTTIDSPLPLAARRLLIAQFTPEALIELGHQLQAAAPGRRAHQQLDDAGVDALAEMLAAGRTPTIGWWMRHAH